MTIHVESDIDEDSWDEFVSQFPHASPFHTHAWAACFNDENLTPVYLHLRSGNETLGAVAGVIVEPKIAMLRGIDRRLSLFTGPALHRLDRETIRNCLLSLRGFAKDQGFTSLMCSARDYPHSYDWGSNKAHMEYLEEYIVDLRGDWKDITGRMRKSIREQARKAERSGLSFHRHPGAAMLPELLKLLANTWERRIRKSGIRFSSYYLPHLSAESLARLADSRIAHLYTAHREDRVLCALLLFAFGSRAYALLIGTSDEGYSLRAPAFLWLNTIRELKSRGVTSLNLAGAGIESGHAFAKVSLGAVRTLCTGSVSQYLKSQIRNALFQSYRWLDRSLFDPAISDNRTLGRI